MYFLVCRMQVENMNKFDSITIPNNSSFYDKNNKFSSLSFKNISSLNIHKKTPHMENGI